MKRLLAKRLLAALSALIASPAGAGDSNCGTPLPASVGSGFVAGTPVSSTTKVYWARDAFLYGFDWFTTYNQYFPQLLTQAGALAPGAQVVDMAYASGGVMRFDNVVVPSDLTYQISFRYAFTYGLFPGVTDRPEGLMVDGQAVAIMDFWITDPTHGTFGVFCHSWVNVHLSAGRHEILLYNISDHGVARIDDMTVSPSTGLAPPKTASQCNQLP